MSNKHKLTSILGNARTAFMKAVYGIKILRDCMAPPLIRAVISGDVNRVKYWINQKVDINEQWSKTGQTALMLAFQRSSPEICRLLLDAGAGAGIIKILDNDEKDALFYAHTYCLKKANMDKVIDYALEKIGHNRQYFEDLNRKLPVLKLERLTPKPKI